MCVCVSGGGGGGGGGGAIRSLWVSEFYVFLSFNGDDHM